MRRCLSHLRVRNSRKGGKLKTVEGEGESGKGGVRDHKGADNGGSCPSIQ